VRSSRTPTSFGASDPLIDSFVYPRVDPIRDLTRSAIVSLIFDPLTDPLTNAAPCNCGGSLTGTGRLRVLLQRLL